MSNYQAKIICDSITPDNVRALTIEMRYPYAIHQDMLTYRSIGKSNEQEFEQWLEFSRNSASNRALTTEAIVKGIYEDNFLPVPRKATAGMVPGDLLEGKEKEEFLSDWMFLRDATTQTILEMKNKPYRIHKSVVNRYLAPYQGITTVFTSNEQHWLHFFEERAHEAADPLLQPVAYLAQDAYRNSIPNKLKYGEWHLPYIISYQQGYDIEDHIKISVARCARTSWLRQDINTNPRDDLKLFNDLIVREPEDKNPVHASPSEHQLQATHINVRSGNIYGYHQYRKILGL